MGNNGKRLRAVYDQFDSVYIYIWLKEHARFVVLTAHINAII